MRYRKLNPKTGDMMFGSGQADFYRDQPEAVAQLVLTRLMLWYGTWFADLSEGTPWQTEVLGERTRQTRDVMLRARVNDTDGVSSIRQYASHTDPNQRDWSAALIVDTIYGAAALRATKLPGTVPDLPIDPIDPIDPTSGAQLLGIVGGTALSMTPANIAVGPRADIADFQIERLEGGTW